MKIISKIKDYYDYLVGIYGVDEKIILERKNEFMPPVTFIKSQVGNGIHGKPNFEIEIFRLFICDIGYDVINYAGNFYYLDQLKQYGREISLFDYNNLKNSVFKPEDYLRVKCNGVDWVLCTKPYKVNYNTENNCPILYSSKYKVGDSFEKFPVLTYLKFSSVMSAEKIYIELSNWLSKKDDINDTRTNEEKILTNGFDKKISFRG